jgi:cyclophilin family peptidyl-prolyl cis-trans isomerase
LFSSFTVHFSFISSQFDISINDSPAGRIVFKLCGDVTPKTCDNFRKLYQKLDINGAQCQDGYAGSKFHRIIPSSCARAATSPATMIPAGAPSTARSSRVGVVALPG